MEMDIEVPVQRLAKETVSAIRIGSIISHGIMIVILAVLYGVNAYFSWGAWIDWVVYALAALTLLSAIWGIGFRPVYLVRHYRYGLDAEFLQLKSGAFNEIHQLIPMAKIQAVSTNQGPVLRRFGLYSLDIETMGSSHGIPALPKDVAFEVRNQIAQFAKIKEVDE